MSADGRPHAMLPWTFSAVAPDEARGVVPGRLTFTVPAGFPAAQVRWRVALSPAEDAATLPDEVFKPWADVLAEGVIGRCMADVGRPWSSVDAGAHLAQFEIGCARAGVRAWRGFTDKTPRARVGWC